MKEMFKLGTILMLIAAASGGILSFANSKTKPVIEKIQLEQTIAAYKEIMPEADDFKPLEEQKLSEIKAKINEIDDIYVGYKGGNQIGYTFKTKSFGYGGQMINVIGIDEKGIVTGYRAVENSETAGFGDRVFTEEFYPSFTGKNVNGGSLKAVLKPEKDDEVQALSGATISTKGVMSGINGAVKAYCEYLKK